MKFGVVIGVACLLSGAVFAQSGRTAFGGGSGGKDTAASRINDLEMQVQNLQMQLNNLSKPAPGVSPDEVAALRREVAALRAENAELRKLINDLPAKLAQEQAKRVPPAPKPSSGNQPQVGYEHAVEQGQTLSEIAQAYGVKLDAIVKANNFKDANVTIRVGQKIFIPKQ